MCEMIGKVDPDFSTGNHRRSSCVYQIGGRGYRTLAGKLGRVVSNKRFALAVVLEELIVNLRGGSGYFNSLQITGYDSQVLAFVLLPTAVQSFGTLSAY